MGDAVHQLITGFADGFDHTLQRRAVGLEILDDAFRHPGGAGHDLGHLGPVTTATKGSCKGLGKSLMRTAGIPRAAVVAEIVEGLIIHGPDIGAVRLAEGGLLRWPTERGINGMPDLMAEVAERSLVFLPLAFPWVKDILGGIEGLNMWVRHATDAVIGDTTRASRRMAVGHLRRHFQKPGAELELPAFLFQQVDNPDRHGIQRINDALPERVRNRVGKADKAGQVMLCLLAGHDFCGFCCGE